MISVRRDIGSVLEMGGSLDSSRKSRIILATVGIAIVSIGTAWYFSLPLAMERNEFRDTLTAHLKNNFAQVDRHEHLAASKLAATEHEYGPIERLDKFERILNPRWTYPTLQAEAIVVRGSSRRYETYTFRVDDMGRLILVGFSSGSPR